MKSLPMALVEVPSFADLWAFGAGRPIVREETIDLRWSVTRPPWAHDDEREVCIAWFSDTDGIAIGLRGDGPPYSEVTPDPQWEAQLYFYVAKP